MAREITKEPKRAQRVANNGGGKKKTKKNEDTEDKMDKDRGHKRKGTERKRRTHG